jgi:hypothetical protein
MFGAFLVNDTLYACSSLIRESKQGATDVLVRPLLQIDQYMQKGREGLRTIFGRLNVVVSAACSPFDHHHITTDITSKLLDLFDAGVDSGDVLFRRCNVVLNVGDHVHRSFRSLHPCHVTVPSPRFLPPSSMPLLESNRRSPSSMSVLPVSLFTKFSMP